MYHEINLSSCVLFSKELEEALAKERSELQDSMIEQERIATNLNSLESLEKSTRNDYEKVCV